MWKKFLMMVIALAVGVSLAACGNAVEPFRLTAAAVEKFDCTNDNYVGVSNALNVLLHADKSTDVDEALAAWGFKSQDDPRIKTTLDALRNKCGEGEKSSEPSATTTPTPSGLEEDKVAKAFADEMTKLGFKPGEVSVGKVDWDKNPVDRRDGAVGDRITNPQELTKFLNGNSAASKAARAHVQAGLSEAEAKRALNGNNYVPVQYNVDVKYRGNTYITSGGKLGRGGDTTTKKGDVVWVFVTRDYKIVWESSVRADCANPGFTHPPRPAKPVAPGKGGGGPKPPKNPPGSTPECVDIPGNGVYDCGSKPADGDYHTGGASKGQVTAPADAAPKPVETSKPGGRGGSVNDSPTNPPGSETGGQAPGADPPETSAPPPPATGTDGDGDAGSVNPGDEPTDENTGDPGNPF